MNNLSDNPPRDFKELMKEEFGVETPATKEEVKKAIDVSNFKSITYDDLVKILGLTIKRDETNKIITFLAQLSAYTEDSQVNISFNAPSSTGKSFIPLEIVSLFPEEDVIKLGNCSPTAFYHEQGELTRKPIQSRLIYL